MVGRNGCELERRQRSLGNCGKQESCQWRPSLVLSLNIVSREQVQLRAIARIQAGSTVCASAVSLCVISFPEDSTADRQDRSELTQARFGCGLERDQPSAGSTALKRDHKQA